MNTLKTAAALLLAACCAQAAEQEKAPPKPWQHNLVGSLSLTQIALKDWSQGGDDALSWTLTLDGKSEYDSGRYNWRNTYKFAFGQTKLGGQELRKTDDKIRLATTLTYNVGKHVDPYIGATAKTQFAKGYRFEETGKVALSQFFDPAYFTQSAGVGVKPLPQVKTRLGLALRQILTRDFNSFSNDPETAKTEKFDLDGGIESITEVEWKVMEDVLYTSELEVFLPLADVGATAVSFDNTVALKVNSYVNVNINLQLIDDQTASDKVQLKEALAVGLSYSFL